MANRIIKFRAFNPKTKEMMTPEFLGENWTVNDLNPPNEWKVMQFCGLKDKNGKEIYEGDLIKDIKGDIREVKYIDNGFWCEYPNGDHYFPANGHREIIGNIYENPELISVDN